MNVNKNENTCYGCRQPMPDGVRFCVTCGKHNFSADSTVGPSLAEHAKQTAENRDAIDKMEAVGPFLYRWLVWLVRRQ